LKERKKKEEKTGLGWPVSPGARKGPGSGSIFSAHIQTGLFSPALKSPLPGRAGPSVLTALASMLVNGSLTCEFNLNRGLGQGDPSSPFIFLVVVEWLNIY
jgi:hypothetical protein